MMRPISFLDAEQLSAYLDDQLSKVDRQRLEARLNEDSELRNTMNDLSQARSLLRKLPARKAPKNFRLSPEMAGVRPPLPLVFPVFRFASIMAAILLFFSFAANLSLPMLNASQAAVPAPAAGLAAAAPNNRAAALPPAVGGGPTSFSAQDQSTSEPTLEVAPQVDSSALGTPTIQYHMMLEAATPTPELISPAETQVPPGAMAKSAPLETETAAPEVTQNIEPSQPVVPVGFQLGLLALAVVSGGFAYTLKAWVEGNWFKAHAHKPAKLTISQIVLIILMILVALTAAIILLSAYIHAP